MLNFLKKDLIFLEQFLVHSKIESKVQRDVPYNPPPLQHPPLSTCPTRMGHVTGDEPTLMYYKVYSLRQSLPLGFIHSIGMCEYI